MATSKKKSKKKSTKKTAAKKTSKAAAPAVAERDAIEDAYDRGRAAGIRDARNEVIFALLATNNPDVFKISQALQRQWALGANGGTPRLLRIEIFQGKNKLWWWNAVAGNGEIVASSGGDGFTREADAHRAAARLVELVKQLPL
jgi:uncharacterized protein YegP (UPF0339 family)